MANKKKKGTGVAPVGPAKIKKRPRSRKRKRYQNRDYERRNGEYERNIENESDDCEQHVVDAREVIEARRKERVDLIEL